MASLGTLTVNVVAQVSGFVQGMDKAERVTRARTRQIKRDLKELQSTFKVVAAAAVASVSAITVSTINSGREIARFSRLAGTSAREFQRFAAGAGAAGISQEKLADILKDVNDKVGDFLITGAGPLADFFEQIAPKIGLTADAFRGLNGADALQLYVSSLEKANVSQQELTFFLEAIASDATLLLPLLKNNGQALQAFGDAAEAAGAIIGDKTLRELRDLDAAMFILEKQAAGIKLQIAEGVIPALSAIAQAFVITQGPTKDLDREAGLLAKTLGLIAASGISISAIFRAAGRGIATTALLIKESFGDAEGEELQQRIAAIIDTYGDAGDVLEKAGRDISALNARIAGSAGSASERIDEIRAAFDALNAGGAGGAGVGTQGKIVDGLAEIEVSAKRVKNTLTEWIQEQARYSQILDGLKTDEEVITDTLKERLEAVRELSVVRFGSDQEARSRAVAAAATEAPEAAGLAPEVGGAFGELQRLDEAAAELEQWRQNELARFRSYYDERLITLQEFQEAEAATTQEHQDRLRDIESARQRASLVATGELFGNLAQLTGAFVGEQSDAYRALFAVSKAAAIAESIVNIQAAIAKAANNPFPANLGAIATVVGQTAGILATIQSVTFQGQAHDGLMSVPRTGTYLLERGERVTTAETSAKLDSTLSNLERGGVGGGVRIVNQFDDGFIGDYMASSSGERVIMNAVRKNQRTIKGLAAQ